MYLWYLEKIWRKSANPDTKKVSGTKLCRHDLAKSAESADFWLSGRHVADMSATFPAKQMKSREIEAAHRCRALEESHDRLSLDYDRLYSDYQSQLDVIDDLQQAWLGNNNDDGTN